MHWTKRSIFFVTLVAFLSNLAFGMSVPDVQETARFIGHPGFKFLQKSHVELTFSAFETLEELEELEQETDLDSSAASHVFFSQKLGALTTNYHLQKRQSKRALYERDAFRSWLWLKQTIFIHFQVFRI